MYTLILILLFQGQQQQMTITGLSQKKCLEEGQNWTQSFLLNFDAQKEFLYVQEKK